MDTFSLQGLFFLIFAFTSILSATGVVLVRDPIKSAMSLIACFFSIAVLYLLQAAELLAVLEILVYAGAIMVLFVFVIMLVENREPQLIKPTLIARVGAGVKIAAVGLVTLNLLALVLGAGPDFAAQATLLPDDFGSPASIGRVFFSDYLFHFELASVLLLIAIVGAIIVSRDENEDQGSR